MPRNFDHIADSNGVELYRLSMVHSLPEFIKKASPESVYDVKNVAASNYADVISRQFPCHTPQCTWLSAAFFFDKKAEFNAKDQRRIEDRIEKFAAHWGIKGEFNAVKARSNDLEKTATDVLPDSSYAWVWVGDNGVKDRRLPLRNALEVKTASDWLQTYRDSFTYADRNRMATKILEKAAQFGAAIGANLEFLEKQAGHGVCNPKEVHAMLQDRIKLANNDAHKDMLKALADSVLNTPKMVLTGNQLVKLATVVDTTDRALNLTKGYGNTLQRPEDVIFKVTFAKTASELEAHVATTSGRMYNKQDFGKVALDDLKSLFGDEFADRVRSGLDVDAEKLAEEIATLPRPDAEMFDSLMSEVGVKPSVVKTAGVRMNKAAAAHYANLLTQ